MVAFAQRKPLRHRLNALAIARDRSVPTRSGHIWSPCLVTQPIQKRLEPTASSSLQSDVLRTMVGPSKKPTTHESQKKVIWESSARENLLK